MRQAIDTDHRTRWWSGVRRRLAALACATVLLAACGGNGEDGDDAAPDDGAATEPDEVQETEEPDDVGSEDPDGDDADEPEGDDEGEDEGGVTQHRPPDEAEELADCDGISDDAPGATIAFPSDQDSDWLDAGEGPVAVEVLGCSNTFEANIEYEAFHGQNSSPTLDGFTSGGTMGEWAEFRFSETYWTPGEWTVVVFELDAESGDRREYDSVTFTVD